MKSRTYTGWAVQIKHPKQPAYIANVLYFGGEPPAHVSALRSAVFSTRAAARLACESSANMSVRNASLVKVKIKFEVIA